MKLIKARIRGTGKLRESEWFEVSPRLNLFQFLGEQGPENGRNFLRILQTINPTYAVRTRKPFGDLPTHIDQNGHTRRINPAKRTIALAVFSATPELVRELVLFGEWFYETDRIEVGRRFDYSRWINFVELASSTRWSEVSADFENLLAQACRMALSSTTPPSDMHSLKPTDRIIDPLQHDLLQWLHRLPSELQQNCQQLIENAKTAVLRATHFHTARNLVRTRMPLFVVLGTEPEQLSLHNLLHMISEKANSAGEQSKDDARIFLNTLNDQLTTMQFSDMVLQLEPTPAEVLLKRNGKPVQMPVAETNDSLVLLKQMQIKAALAIAYSRIACQTEPILLFAGPERQLSTALHPELAHFIINISGTCQCLYSFSDVDIFPDDAAQRRYNIAKDSLVPMPVDEHQ